MSENQYDNLLAIDTSSSTLGLAVSYGQDRLVQSQTPVEKSHGQVLLKQIDNLFNSIGVSADQLDAIVVNTGPGSFTGLRVGLAAAKGMAVALNISLIGVNVFERVAHGLGQSAEKTWVMVPIRKNEFALAPIVNGRFQKSELITLPLEQLLDKTGSEVIVGVTVDPATLLAQPGRTIRASETKPDPATLIYCGREKLKRGVKQTLEEIEPMYVQKSQAELRFEERQRNKDRT